MAGSKPFLVASGAAALALISACTSSRPNASAIALATDLAAYHRITDGKRFVYSPNPSYLYPKAAYSSHIKGDVILHCHLLSDRHLHGCIVQEEHPPGLGFGAASVTLAALVEIRPLILDGETLKDELVEFPVKWDFY